MKLWGNNFKALPSDEILSFTSGWDVRGKAPYDERLIAYDIKLNKAHVKMLSKQNMIAFLGETIKKIFRNGVKAKQDIRL